MLSGNFEKSEHCMPFKMCCGFESITIKLLKVHPIAAVEIEISPWSYEDETKKGMTRNIFLGHVLTVISNSHCNGEGAWCCCSGILVSLRHKPSMNTPINTMCSRPLGQGIFAKKMTFDDLPSIARPFFHMSVWTDIWTPGNDIRRVFTRFREEVNLWSWILPDYLSPFPQNFSHNLILADALAQIARKKGVTLAQLSISWVSSLGRHVIPLPGSSYAISSACQCPLAVIKIRLHLQTGETDSREPWGSQHSAVDWGFERDWWDLSYPRSQRWQVLW